MIEALAVRDPGRVVLDQQPTELSILDVVARVAKVREVQKQVMKPGHHFGRIPGTDKPTLLKPGAEVLGMVFRFAPRFNIEEHRDGEHRDITVTCTLSHQVTGAELGSGIGSCSTRESKYAWRKATRACPQCGEPAIIKGKAEYGSGWLCFAKKGGCGAKFQSGDASIEAQETGRVPNPDIADTYNTVLKMAVKRAHVAAILFATAAGDIFTQDLEDMHVEDDVTAIHDAMTAIEAANTKKDLDAVGAMLAQLTLSNEGRQKLRQAYAVKLNEIQAAANNGDKGKPTEDSQPTTAPRRTRARASAASGSHGGGLDYLDPAHKTGLNLINQGTQEGWLTEAAAGGISDQLAEQRKASDLKGIQDTVRKLEAMRDAPPEREPGEDE